MATIGVSCCPPDEQRRCNAIIKLNHLSRKHEETITTYTGLQALGYFADNFTFPILLKTASNLSSLSLASTLHGQAIKSGYSSHPFVQTALINVYSSLNCLKLSRQVFDDMPLRDTTAWNSILDAHARRGRMGECVKLFDSMPAKDQISFNIMTCGFARAGDVSSAEKFFSLSPAKDSFSWNSMISAYAKAGDMAAARALFGAMPREDLVSWNTVLAGYLDHQCYEEVLQLFCELLQQAELEPNHVTLSVSISACAHIGSLETGRKVHAYAERLGLASTPHVATALVDMYSKCGSIEEALVLFYKTRRKDLYLWNAMISGLAFHGHGKASIRLFDEMRHRGLKPDKVSFVGVLSACSHSGLVSEGLGLFECMESVHGVRAGPEHYGCVVDLLGRAGELGKAREVVEGMPFEPGPAVLGALMGASLVHGELELGMEVGKWVVEKGEEGLSDGEYVMMASVCELGGRWEEGRRWRERMREEGVRKGAGWSGIEVGGKMYRFVAGEVQS